jgi:hypothetical protein
MTSSARRDAVMALLGDVGLALDDDDIADRLGMNRHYVNAVCRRLADEGLIQRGVGPDGKLVNSAQPPSPAVRPSSPEAPTPAKVASRTRVRRQDRARRNVNELIGTFDRCVAHFEQSNAFAGPSLYFHERALARRRTHSRAVDLMEDELFFEYVYAVLPAWGMHRMGRQAAKVGEFRDMVESFRGSLGRISALWHRRIVAIEPADADDVAAEIWEIVSSLKVSTSGTRIVAGSKALHHALPDLVPPIDRQYTFRFFTGQMTVAHGERQAFLEWFPLLCEIGRSRRSEIERAVERGGFMATGPAKVVDNAVMGFMQLHGVVAVEGTEAPEVDG